MFYLRILSALTGICFFGAAGMRKSALLKKRCESLSGILLALSRAQAEIRLGTELPEILKNGLGDYFDTDGFSFSPRDGSALCDADAETVSALAQSVGMAETEDAEARLSAYRDALSEALGEAKREYREKGRLYSLGGWLLGLTAAIMIF